MTPSVEHQKVLYDVSSAVMALKDGKGEEVFRLLSRESVKIYLGNLPKDIQLGTSILTIMGVNAEKRDDWASAIENYESIVNLQGDEDEKDGWRMLLRARVQYAHQLLDQGKSEDAAYQSTLAETSLYKHCKAYHIKVLKFDGPINSQGCPEPWILTINAEKATGEVSVDVVEEDGQEPALRLVTNNSSGAVGCIGWINQDDTPIITWEWRTDEFPELGDIRKAETDDQACQLVFAFIYQFRFYLFQYGWDNTAPVGTTCRRDVSGGYRPYQMFYLVVRSGKSPKGEWVRERRNLADDLKTVFGSETVKKIEEEHNWPSIPADAKVHVVGVAVQGNTQHAGGRSQGLFRTILLFPD